MDIFVVATFSEAKAFIDEFRLSLKEKKPFLVYEKDSIAMCISGIGKLNSAIATTYILNLYKDTKSITNFGICGSSDTNKQIGSIHKIKSIIDKDSNKKYNICKNGQKLYCFSKAITSLDTLALVDMESSGFYLSAKTFIEPNKITLYKIVSDYLDDDLLDSEFIYNITKKNIGVLIESISHRS